MPGALPAAVVEVQTLLGHRRVRKAAEWGQLFNAQIGPPRGVLARLTRKFGVAMHPRRGKWNYKNMASFKREVDRMEAWYKPGRRLDRRPQRPGVPARKTIWNKKVKVHYRRLRHPVRLEGLGRWRLVAQAMRLAKVEMHTGTVAVERMWASMRDMFPASARKMSKG